MSYTRLLSLLLLTTMFVSSPAQGQKPHVVIDTRGVMRKATDDSELHGFGVNYSLPFAHEYRMVKQRGIRIEEAIDRDVYHMTRLDIDLYRVHVWDTEISDSLGNLIPNEHLRLFDYTIHQMKKRGMRFVITPIAFWGNGWPEKDETTPGFSHKYGKADCLTHPEAIKAQANYLFQFLNHVNAYTGIAYKDETDIVALEISNEPHHKGTAKEVTQYINTMVKAMRKSGTQTPIFYNMSHSIHLADAYMNANIQGGTFQWYPTNLVANHQIDGNFLPHVADYVIPFANHPKFGKMAKIVYEFDPADVGTNVMYPAMAIAFRKAGMQLANQFAYDAIDWAPFNTNYGTHFMNLAYAPAKAISLKIASAVFHNMPMGSQKQPDALLIDYPNDLTQWNTPEKFFYSNTTSHHPINVTALQEIAGCGSSPVIQYDGTGSYFLDRISNDVWRLEVMPDAWWIDDPYSKASPSAQKAAVMHATRNMCIELPTLGKQFTMRAINDGNHFSATVKEGAFTIRPGVYLLSNRAESLNMDITQTYRHIRLNEYVAPASDLPNTALWNHTPAEQIAGQPVNIQFTAVSPDSILAVKCVTTLNERWETLTANSTGANSYRIDLPNDMTRVGLLQYRIIIETTTGTYTFPSGEQGDPWRWDIIHNPVYTLRLSPKASQLVLWEAEKDWEHSYKTWYPTVNLMPTAQHTVSLNIAFPELPAPDVINPDKKSYAFKFFSGHRLNGRQHEITEKKHLMLKVTNNQPTAQPIEVGLSDKNGSVAAARVTLKPGQSVYSLPLSALQPAKYLIIPRPYPDFLPYKTNSNRHPLDLSQTETMQLEVLPGESPVVNVNIEKIWIE
ncbi:MAG: hypothetical protein JXR39_02775 [Marinilabiliaceae bacterium]|nr:hypothetical protein [Marinilabiliaceae bacterium]